ncbi:MAG: hypothetical protein KDC07_01835 [Chitinophagaceae bacterium]|nr:hypothetical protein [Chitinophagaceae bacterium]MCB9047524.1 hypothetical protein [Chitinophagales bacterium]
MMSKHPKNILLLLSVPVLLIYGCGKDPVTTPDPEPQDTTTWNKPAINPLTYTRDSAVNDYKQMYLASALTSVNWTGSTTGCNAGTVPQNVHDAVLKRINYFRKITGLNYNCVMDESLYAAQQQTALMMTANGDLDHNPPTSWSCYTTEGADGAKKSNLRLGSSGSIAVDAFMEDSEEYNVDAGHRRWLLYSKQSAFSHGTTDDVEVIHVLVKSDNTYIPEFIAYPPANFVPIQVMYPRWSFSIPDADFSAAKVTVKSDGQNMSLDVVSRTTKVADNTIVWDMGAGSIPSDISTDKTYTVTVSGVKGTSKDTYTYDVVMIKP